jgi:hypothetical protein
LVSYVYILRDMKHPRFKIGKANNILARARSFRRETIDFQESLGLRLVSEADAYVLEKILHRTFRLAGVDPLEVVASGGSSDGASEWFSTSCWARLVRYLKDNQDLYPHETISGKELAALLKEQLVPSQAVLSREQIRKEKEARRNERELEAIEYRRTQLECLRASLNTVQPIIAQELDRLRLNGNIAGIYETSMGACLLIADRVPLPSGALLWGLKPHSTNYEYPGGFGSIMGGFNQVTSLSGTVSKVGLPSAYKRTGSFSEEDEIICDVFREEFEWLRQLQQIPDAWVSVIFPIGGFFSSLSDSPELAHAMEEVMDALSKHEGRVANS